MGTEGPDNVHTIDARAWREVSACPEIEYLACSDEMAPWSLGNDYDRPIPRRIVEEAGIPRALFGHTIYMTIEHGREWAIHYGQA